MIALFGSWRSGKLVSYDSSSEVYIQIMQNFTEFTENLQNKLWVIHISIHCYANIRSWTHWDKQLARAVKALHWKRAQQDEVIKKELVKSGWNKTDAENVI